MFFPILLAQTCHLRVANGTCPPHQRPFKDADHPAEQRDEPEEPDRPGGQRHEEEEPRRRRNDEEELRH